MSKYKQYLGDSVYADYQNGMIKLTTENGINVQQTIFLEAEVYTSLLQWVQWLREQEDSQSHDFDIP